MYGERVRAGTVLAVLCALGCGRLGYETGDGSAAATFAPCTAGDDGNFIDPDTGNCYMRFETALTWDESVALCETLGAEIHLATITDATENARVTSALVPDGGCAYLGGTDRAVENEFSWITGEPFSFSNFESGEPNNDGEEDCLQMFSDGQWNDIDCAEQFPCICERPGNGPPPACNGGVLNPATGGCFVLVEDAVPWEDAVSSCADVGEGFHIATIRSSAANLAVRSLLVGTEAAWVGASDTAAEGQFEWVTGEPMTFDNWDEGEPNNQGETGDEDCLEVRASGLWNDAECPILQPYVCERDPA